MLLWIADVTVPWSRVVRPLSAAAAVTATSRSSTPSYAARCSRRSSLIRMRITCSLRFGLYFPATRRSCARLRFNAPRRASRWRTRWLSFAARPCSYDTLSLFLRFHTT